MSREILFKAKRIDNSEWVEGYLFFIVDTPYIICDGETMCMDGENTDLYAKLQSTGVVLSYICPLMYMNNPLAKKMPVITNSNKLRTYTTSRYYTSEEILDIITKEAK